MTSLKRIATLTLCVIALSFINSCSQQTAATYAEKKPELALEDYFNGSLVAHGVLKNRGGEVTRRFVAQLEGSWQNGVGTLDETFIFDDGEQQERVWTLRPAEGKDPNTRYYTGTAGDVTGQANISVSGNAMFLKYTLQVPYKGDTIEVAVDDRMYLIDDDVLLNESGLTKWGFDVGELLLSIRKLD